MRQVPGAHRPVHFPVSRCGDHGVLGTSILTFLRQLGKRITAQTGEKREAAWLLERISLAVGVAARTHFARRRPGKQCRRNFHRKRHRLDPKTCCYT